MISALPSLRSRTAKEVEGILSSLTLELLPNPGISRESKPLNPKLRDRLLREIRVNLRLKRTDNSPESMGKIHGYLADQIHRAVLSGVDIKDVKRRLGQSGDLAPALYKVEFRNSFIVLDETRGVQRAQVQDTLRYPDSVEHLSPGALPEENQQTATSIYVKGFRNRIKPENSYTLLVFCSRVGYIQEVRHAWYVFHSEVDLDDARTALDVLKSFLLRYGIELNTGKHKGKLFLGESVQLRDGGKSETTLINLQRGVPIGSLDFEIGPITDNDDVIIYWIFGVNYIDYEAMLGRHGVKIKQSKIRKDPNQVTAITVQKIGSQTCLRIMDESGNMVGITPSQAT